MVWTCASSQPTECMTLKVFLNTIDRGNDVMFNCRQEEIHGRQHYDGELGPQSYQPWQIPHYHLVCTP